MGKDVIEKMAGTDPDYPVNEGCNCCSCRARRRHMKAAARVMLEDMRGFWIMEPSAAWGKLPKSFDLDLLDAYAEANGLAQRKEN